MLGIRYTGKKDLTLAKYEYDQLMKKRNRLPVEVFKDRIIPLHFIKGVPFYFIGQDFPGRETSTD